MDLTKVTPGTKLKANNAYEIVVVQNIVEHKLLVGFYTAYLGQVSNLVTVPYTHVVQPKATPGAFYVNKFTGSKAVGATDGKLRIIYCSQGKPITFTSTEDFDPNVWVAENTK